MISDIAAKSCQPCVAGSAVLTGDKTVFFQQQIDVNWQLNENNGSIKREFRFKNYYQTMAFVNMVAWVAHAQDHHPDIELSYNRCFVTFSTHSIGGLSENDFICAAKIDALL